MTFGEAMVSVERGKVLTRPHWDGTCIRAIGCVIVRGSRVPEAYYPTQVDMRATDWEVVCDSAQP